ncbi:MAG: aminopeptidase [Defluviitaleaceae bacterium]|nr:aminopeptidase [Defluviitaleaceae bacterium]
MDMLRQERYAELIVRKGANVQKGQKVVVRADIGSAAFVRLVVKAAYDAGAAQVVMNWIDEAVTRMTYLRADDEVFKSVEPWRVQFFKDYDDAGACYIHIISDDPDLLAGVDSERIKNTAKSSGTALAEHRKAVMGNHVRWTIAGVPSKAWAMKVFPNLSDDEAVDALWDKIMESSRVEGDALAAWDEHDKVFKAKVDFMNESKFVSLHIKNSLGTDITMELPAGHYWKGGSDPAKDGVRFFPNIPTEEVFTLPNCYSVNGKVVASMPLVYNGVTIEDFELMFADGKVVSHKAEKNEAALTNILELDEGARMLGEVALVPHASPISQMNVLFNNTLYDENASCHFALGKAYPMIEGYDEMSKEEVDKLGINESITHVDFMFGTSDMQITGTTADGKQVPVFVNGNWA